MSSQRANFHEVTKGTSILLCGGEGSGKSTFLRALAGKLPGWAKGLGVRV